MDKVSWKEFGYLQGLRKARNYLRDNENKFDHVDNVNNVIIKLRNDLDRLHKAEIQRLASKNKDLKKQIEIRIKRNQWNDVKID